MNRRDSSENYLKVLTEMQHDSNQHGHIEKVGHYYEKYNTASFTHILTELNILKAVGHRTYVWQAGEPTEAMVIRVKDFMHKKKQPVSVEVAPGKRRRLSSISIVYDQMYEAFILAHKYEIPRRLRKCFVIEIMKLPHPEKITTLENLDKG